MVFTEEGQRVLHFTEDVFQTGGGLRRELESLRNGKAGRRCIGKGAAYLVCRRRPVGGLGLRLGLALRRRDVLSQSVF